MSVTAISKPDTAPATEEEAADAGGKSRKKLLVVVVLVLALGGGAWTMLRPHPPAAPKPGAVVALDPIQINLAGEHYLRVGIALQLTDGTKEADGSKALDATIEEFTGRSIEDMTDPAKRTRMKKELTRTLTELYDKEVMGVYFTEFVTQ